MSYARPLDPVTCDQVVSSQRWAERVSENDDGCFVYAWPNNADGYGTIGIGRNNYRAHRVAMVAHLGADIPPGVQVDHLCRVRNCVNPAHLEVVEQAVNLARGMSPPARNARKTHCPEGHPLSGDNLRTDQQPGKRGCRTCKLEQSRQQAAAIKAAHEALGMGQVAYIQMFGASRRTAMKVLAAIK